MKKVFIGSDHAGYHLREKIISYLKKEQIPFVDMGNLKYDPNDDYPDFAALVAKEVQKHDGRGILACGSSFGVCIAANKFKGIRAVSINSEAEAITSRKDNDANVLCLSGGEATLRLIKPMKFNVIKKIIDAWLHTTSSQADRHQRRLQKIRIIEKKNFR
jgi:ribose 5-phosphate isomerase B